MWINVGLIIYMSVEAHEWILIIKEGPCVRGDTTDPLSTLYINFNQLKYRGLYPIMLQCGASVAESCSALNQHWVLDMNSRTCQILHFKIELAVTDSDTAEI